MNQFEFMIDTLTDYDNKRSDWYNKDTEDSTAESLALVESTLLHGYAITAVTQCNFPIKRVVERVSL